MVIKSTEPESATQRAQWVSNDGLGWAAVTCQNVRDDRDAMGWSWELSVSVIGGVGFHYTEARDAALIFAPGDDTEPVKVLNSLASFVSAWAEALTYGRLDGENRDLFPVSCTPFVTRGYAEEFSCDCIELEGSES